MNQNERIENLLSAGGVVYRRSNGSIEVVVCGRSEPPIWGLPKGTPDYGETREQTALREVREETGLDVELEGFIDSIDYWFVRSRDGTRCHKTVLYYLMTPSGGDVSQHDHEFDIVTWLPVEEALDTLTYENEVRVVQKGLSMVSKKSGV
ncbi:MAG: NUDIX hydrolase [Chloroflexi bacterium]|nr:NUDIX hydrolase [Chloroflexota bacterium]